MKKLFITILLLLVAASFYTMYTSRDQVTEVPVITWRTDPNPQREEQIMLFREWLVENGHVLKDSHGNVVTYTEEEAAALNEAYGPVGAPLKPGDPHYVKPGSPKSSRRWGSNTSGKRTRDFRGRSIFFCRRWTAPGVWRWRCASPAAAGLTSTTKP